MRIDRVCEPGDAPRVCFDADPDASVSLQVGDVRLAPGECVFGPEDGAGGSLTVALHDGATDDVATKRIGTRKGKSVTVTVQGGAMSVTRTACENVR